MLYIVTGGSGSGKSEYAEEIAVCRYRQAEDRGKLYYIAAMYPQDEECHKRIERHRKMRKEKGFSTIECYHHLNRITGNKRDVMLLECLSNLLANEMYQQEGQIKARGEEGILSAKEAILSPIFQLEKETGSVIVVTNEVFSDGMEYDAETQNYLRLLGILNRELAKKADGVIEVVCGIPLCRKGELPC